MCGLCGSFEPAASTDQPTLEATVRRMADTLAHRGPDDRGLFTDAASGIALGFRRLAILDLTPAGHQPMRSPDGRYTIAFNGEIYNFRALRDELVPRGHVFFGHSDTEVMLAAIGEWGLRGALERMNGMFAFALWDARRRTVSLARDRLGEKPMYYGWSGGAFLFGSELKALRAHPRFVGEIDRGALALLLRHDYLPGPRSIYRGISRLPPGTLLTVGAERREPEPEAYWSMAEVARRGEADPLRGGDREIVDELEALLRDAVKLRMEADVPLGAFLSGGVDSSTVVALMQAQSARPVRTFSIGLVERRFDEAPFARAVARHLGTQHEELIVRPEEALSVIPRLAAIYDEPFADASQIPTVLVSQLARRHVTVSLSGDGGDELFAGYPRYASARRVWRAIGWLPVGARRIAAAAIRATRPRDQSRMARVAGLLAQAGRESVYRALIHYWPPGAEPVLLDRAVAPPLDEERPRAPLSFAGWMMLLDTVTYLPDDILAKVDRASMSVSLEARVPLLDHRVVDYAWRIPPSLRLRAPSKWPLRQVLYRYVPRALIERPKRGFSLPIGDWLRGPLRDWAEDLLDARRLDAEGLLAAAPIRERWRAHLDGEGDFGQALWGVLMFEAWLAATTTRAHATASAAG